MPHIFISSSWHNVSCFFFFFDRWMEGEQGLLFALLKKKKWRGKKLRMPCDLFNSSMTFPPPSMWNNHNHNNNNYYFYGPPQVERPHITESHSNVHTLPISKLRIASPHSDFDYTHSISRTNKNILTFLKIIIQSVLKATQLSIETEDIQMVFGQPIAKTRSRLCPNYSRKILSYASLEKSPAKVIHNP